MALDATVSQCIRRTDLAKEAYNWLTRVTRNNGQLMHIRVTLAKGTYNWLTKVSHTSEERDGRTSQVLTYELMNCEQVNLWQGVIDLENLPVR